MAFLQVEGLHGLRDRLLNNIVKNTVKHHASAKRFVVFAAVAAPYGFCACRTNSQQNHRPDRQCAEFKIISSEHASHKSSPRAILKKPKYSRPQKRSIRPC
jgi:hypothetical protein